VSALLWKHYETFVGLGKTPGGRRNTLNIKVLIGITKRKFARRQCLGVRIVRRIDNFPYHVDFTPIFDGRRRLESSVFLSSALWLRQRATLPHAVMLRLPWVRTISTTTAQRSAYQSPAAYLPKKVNSHSWEELIFRTKFFTPWAELNESIYVYHWQRA